MSRAIGGILEEVGQLIGDTSTETKAKLLIWANTVYYEIAEGGHQWQTLVDKITNPGTVLPSDMSSPVYVEDDTDEVYFRSSLKRRYTERNHLFNWFENFSATTSPLGRLVNDGAITAGAKALTSASNPFTAAMAGEYVTIGENRGKYKIAALVGAGEVTLQDPFRGDTETAAHIEVRPTGTLAMLYHDENGDSITSSTIKFWYVRSPLPLYNDYDLVELPGDCKALMLGILRLAMVSQKYDNDALKQVGDFDLALARMKALSPEIGQVNRPTGADGQRTRFGRNRNTADGQTGIHDRGIF